VAARVEFCTKPGAERHDDVTGLLITDHQAVFPLGQVQRHQEAQASIQAVLIALSWRSVVGSVIDPPNDLRESPIAERVRR